MIHSCAGGALADNGFVDVVKVKTYEGSLTFLICRFANVKVGDKVIGLQFGKELQGEVVRVDKNVSTQATPVPLKRMGEVTEVIKC